jgi:hypothetical protein
MKISILASLILIIFYQSAFSQDHNHGIESKTDTTKKSIKSVAMQDIGDMHIHIDYYAPAVRYRIIYGGLVPYNEVWVTGAHNATAITFSHDVLIGNTRVKKGKYAFFTIPNKDSWTLIINSNYNQHLADDYDAKLDIVRMEVKPEIIPNQERLKYAIEKVDNSTAYISMSWEKLKVQFLVKRAQ